MDLQFNCNITQHMASSLFFQSETHTETTNCVCSMFYFLLKTICPQPLLLTGHHGEVTAMTFGKGSRPVLLCSASADYVIVWDIENCQSRVQDGKRSKELSSRV